MTQIAPGNEYEVPGERATSPERCVHGTIPKSACEHCERVKGSRRPKVDERAIAEEIIAERERAVSPPTVPDDAVDIMRECEKCGGVECECRAPLEGVQETIDLMAALKSSLEKTAAERIAALESDVARLTRERDEWEQAAKNAGLAAAIAMQRTEELVGKLADARKKNGGSP